MVTTSKLEEMRDKSGAVVGADGTKIKMLSNNNKFTLDLREYQAIATMGSNATRKHQMERGRMCTSYLFYFP